MKWKFEKTTEIVAGSVTDKHFEDQTYPLKWDLTVPVRSDELLEANDMLDYADQAVNLNKMTYAYKGKLADGSINTNIYNTNAVNAREFIKKITTLLDTWKSERLSDYGSDLNPPLNFDKLVILYKDPTPGSCSTAVMNYPGQNIEQ